VINVLLILVLGWYLITNLQWYNYKLDRVILKHHKIEWHSLYFIIPIVLYYILPIIYFSVYFVFHLIAFYFWNKHLDKALILTERVKRFFIILFLVVFILNGLMFLSNNHIGVIVPLFLAWGISTSLEKILFISYKHKAKIRLKEDFKDLMIITITASYGKTSIKNFLYQILSKKYNVYMTPRSVNTIGGIVKDINEDLPIDSNIYITEAGAREIGDIQEIALFLEPQYIIIGQIGPQHLEYFKTIDNIINTKMELLYTPQLQYGLIHTSIPLKQYDKNIIEVFPKNLVVTRSDLHGIWFDLEIDKKVEHFHSSILGGFNATNLTAAILMAKQIGFSIEEIKLIIDDIKSVDHRLQLIQSNGKMIIDDSFNGNFEGISEGIEIIKTYNGRKVIVTPGLVEASVELNKQLIKKIDEVFDIVIITSKLNKQLFKSGIKKAKLIHLDDKSLMTNLLAQETKIGNLIYFANDAPNFI
jgi:UDP-N-acetylmuramoyl-tripeptide--D-alanyl-D-alanine ligase